MPLTFDATGPSTQPRPGPSASDQHTGSGPTGACTAAACTSEVGIVMARPMPSTIAKTHTRAIQWTAVRVVVFTVPPRQGFEGWFKDQSRRAR